jgi:ubiquitin C-terminal hydrolase
VHVSSTLACACGHSSTLSVKELLLLLPGPQTSVTSALENYCQAVPLPDHTCLSCSARGRARLSRQLARLPACLLLMHQAVQFRRQRPKKHAGPGMPESKLRLPAGEYLLGAVVMHQGAADFGHYYCVRRDGGDWLRCDD